MSSFDYLKTAIKQQGCTLQQVADASGMTKGYLSQLLNAKIKSPSAQKLEALHRFLGLEFPRQKKTIGVVFGKFYPLHTGHIYLIQRACSQVDELHIIMGFDDTRDRALFEDSAMSQQPTVPDRLRWLLQTFKYQKNIRIHAFNEEGMEPYPHGWDVWSNGIKKFMAEKGIQPDLIYTSEEADAPQYMEHLGIETVLVDPKRTFMSISGAQIRENPFRYWEYIPTEVKPFFVRTVAILGGESSGKSTLIVADKWLSAKWVYAICHTIGAITLFMAAQVTTPEAMFLVILINSFAYMPTLGLINTISYYRLQNAGMDIVTDFPPIRIWGTIGFIMAMWVVSLSGFELSHMQLYIGAALSAILVLFTLTLPHIPVAKQQANQSWTTLLGLDAFALFKNKRMAIFFIFSMLLGAELQITNMFGNTFLHSFDKDPMFASSFIVQHASIIMSISQISETLFILTIPFFLSRYGIKNVMMISIVAWILRFALFAYGDPTPFGTVLLVLSMIVYGCAFDFFNISGSVFVEKEVSPAIRASAQGMFLMMTNGFGCILGGIVSGKVVEMYTQNGITDWQTVWLIFAGYSVVLAFAFMAMFKYKHVRVPTGTQTVSH